MVIKMNLMALCVLAWSKYNCVFEQGASPAVLTALLFRCKQ